MPPKILIVDDEEIVCQLLVRALSERDYVVEFVDSSRAAIEKIKRDNFNLLITDLKMPVASGIEMLKEIKEFNPYIEVIIVTGYPTIELAVEAIKIGAFDFVCKPFDLQEIQLTVERCLEKQKFSINYFQLSELTALFVMSKTMTAYTDFDALLGQVLSSSLEVVSAKGGSLFLLDEEKKELSLKAARGLNEEALRNSRIKLGEGIIGRVAQGGNSVLFTNMEDYPGSEADTESRYATKSFLSIPLVSKSVYPQGNVLGVINIREKISGENFTERDKTLLSVLSGQAAITIENYRLYRQLQDKVVVLENTIKKLEETQNQLIQSEKLAAVGQLAFGIAHEIRNPLGIILQGLEFVQGNISSTDAESKDAITKIKKSIDRANNIIIDLLKFSRSSKIEMESVNVRRIMDEVTSFIHNEADLNKVQIIRDYKERDVWIKADPNMLRQAFFNLCINAIDAMPQGGELCVRISSVQKEGAEGQDAVIEIQDTGRGIPEELLPEIFNPFFTTKEPGKGTGLGLSIVHLILQRHKATVDVKSKVDEGTKFTIKLAAEKDRVVLGDTLSKSTAL
ncbi:MAG: response regulator [Candidatus Omnitrophota bacterium]